MNLILRTAVLMTLCAPPALAAELIFSATTSARVAGGELQYFVAGKQAGGDDAACEDGLRFDERFLVVVDGATDKSGRRYAGKTSGRICRDAVLAAFAQVDRRADKRAVVEAINRELQAFYRGQRGLDFQRTPALRPAASVIWYSFARRELVALGDCKARVDGKPYNDGGLLVDELNADLRARVIERLGLAPAQVMRDDLGRRYIMPLLAAAATYRNNPAAPRAFQYWVVDGFPVPPRAIRSWKLAAPPRVIELSSDGYPAFPRASTVSAYEALLARALKRDPLRIGRHRSTKGLQRGQVSFDDRAVLIWRRAR